jgi:hypothetical protein
MGIPCGGEFMPTSSVRADLTESARSNPKARQPLCLAHRGGDADLGGEGNAIARRQLESLVERALAGLVDDLPATDRIEQVDDIVAGFASHQAPSDGRASPMGPPCFDLVARCVAKFGSRARTLSRDVAERGAQPGLKKVALHVDDESGTGGIDVRRVRLRF